MASTKADTPTFDIFEPYRIVQESHRRLWIFVSTRETAVGHAEWQWLHSTDDEEPGWGKSFRRLDHLRKQFLRASRLAGFQIETAAKAYTELFEIHRRISRVSGELLTMHFDHSKRRLAELTLPEQHFRQFHGDGKTEEELASLYNERLYEETWRYNRPILDEFDEEYFRVLNAFGTLAADVNGQHLIDEGEGNAPNRSIGSGQQDGPFERNRDLFIQYGLREIPLMSSERQVFDLLRVVWPPLDGQSFSADDVKEEVKSKATGKKWPTNAASAMRAVLARIPGFGFEIQGDNEKKTFTWVKAITSGTARAVPALEK